jgi:predicted outer membrane repeat protein
MASIAGGAVVLFINSIYQDSSNCNFLDNSAKWFGGAILVLFRSVY